MLDAAADFLQTHARPIDRRRFDLLLRGTPAQGVLDALVAYRNPDDGYGWALEPDLRSPTSQPAAALHALEVLEEAAAAGTTSPLAVALCDWLDANALDGGAVPFSMAGAEGPGTAPWWAGGDPRAPSLHITAAVVEAAQRLAIHDPAVADHPWLERATAWTLAEVAATERPDGGGYVLMYVLRCLDAIVTREGDATAAEHLDRLATLVPRDGRLAVHGGAEGETLELLTVSPLPGTPLRARLDPAAVEADLARLEAERHDDGGWDVGFPTQTALSALEWRGYATVAALKVLRAHGRA